MKAPRMGAGAVKVAPAVTDWLAGDLHPVRKGVYSRQIRGMGQERYSLWNGRYWCAFAGSVDDAAKEFISSAYQDSPWRGLAADPSKAGKA